MSHRGLLLWLLLLIYSRANLINKKQRHLPKQSPKTWNSVTTKYLPQSCFYHACANFSLTNISLLNVSLEQAPMKQLTS